MRSILCRFENLPRCAIWYDDDIDLAACRVFFPRTAALGQLLQKSNPRALRAQAYVADLVRTVIRKPADYPLIPVPTPRADLPRLPRRTARKPKWLEEIEQTARDMLAKN
jgi:hypothetical protein